MVCGLFGGMGGCAMIGQSLINVNSGGRGRLSGITAATCLLMFVLFLSPLIEMISMAALVGVMFMVVIGTFEWASIRMFRRMPASDMMVMILVAGYTVIMHDLASAVILGVIVSALVFTWHTLHTFSRTSNTMTTAVKSTNYTALSFSPRFHPSGRCSTQRKIPPMW